MSVARLYVPAFVPAALRDPAEAAVAPYQLSPNEPGAYTFSVPLVPLDGPDDAEPSHYGCCAPVAEGSDLHAALPLLLAAVPGSAAHAVPVRQYRASTHWHDWLAGYAIKVRRTTEELA